MDELRRDRPGVLLERALAPPAEERSGFVAETCGPDEALREDLATLLAAFESCRATSKHSRSRSSRPSWPPLPMSRPVRSRSVRGCLTTRSANDRRPRDGHRLSGP
jgi:hypothetical protein